MVYGLQTSIQLQNYSLSHLEYFCDLVTVSDNQKKKPKLISGAMKSLCVLW